MRDNLALPGMFRPVTRVEETALDGDECIVEIGFLGSVSVCIDDLESVGVGY